jgi:hypothetical protein
MSCGLEKLAPTLKRGGVEMEIEVDLKVQHRSQGNSN